MISLADNLKQQSADLTATVAAGCGLLSERMIPLNDAARLFPRPGGRQISKVSLWRWATKGVRPRGGGQRVRLATIKAGLTRYTTYEAILRFTAELDGRDASDLPDQGQKTSPIVRAPRKRRAEVSAAAARLKADGFM